MRNLQQQIRTRVRRLGGEFHHAQSGAVALLALAATLILFMTALVMFDSGWASQEKFRAQMSADAASHSSAAVKARAMNSIAYMNVVKRSLVGMYEMYVTMMYAFRIELSEMLECLTEATEELAEFEEEVEEWEEEYDEWVEYCENGGDGGDDGGDDGEMTDGDEAGWGGEGCRKKDAPKKPRAPAGVGLCDGCEAVANEEYAGLIDQFNTLGNIPLAFGGFNFAAFASALETATAEQECPQKELFDAEAYKDFFLFSAIEDPYNLELYTGPLDGIVTRFIRINLRSLSDFQDMLISLAPDWAYAEAEQRAQFSGAFSLEQPAEERAELPVERGTWMDMCLDRQGHIDPNHKSGPELLAEIEANIQSHTNFSLEESGFHELSKSQQAANEYMETIGCEAARTSLWQGSSQRRMSQFMERIRQMLIDIFGDRLAGLLGDSPEITGDDLQHMFPYLATEDHIRDYMQTTRQSKLTTGFARDKFGFLSDDYNNSAEKVPEEYGSMTCAESANLDPEYGMWRASWGARIVPVEECDPELWMHWK
jgi:hypothetical protein